MNTISKKGYVLAMALYFIIISVITSVAIYTYSYHISKEVSMDEANRKKGYYAALGVLRYAAILLKDPQTNFSFDNEKNGQSATRIVSTSYPALAANLGLDANHDVTLVVTERSDGNYDASATYTSSSGEIRLITKIKSASGGTGGAIHGMKVFKTSGIQPPWTVPAQVTKVTVEILGGGGGGDSSSGTGGGAGGYAKMMIPVDSGTTLNFTVAASQPSARTQGNYTKLTYTNLAGNTLTATANGGGGGHYLGAGANGGTCSVTTTIPNVVYLSTKGADSELYHYPFGSGDGASSIYGGGGRGGTSKGSEAGDYGAGGGGYGSSGSCTGGPGLAIVYW